MSEKIFKYFTFKKVKTEYSSLDFRGDVEDGEINIFDSELSVFATNDDINVLISSQFPEIEITEINKHEFVERIHSQGKFKINSKNRNIELYEGFKEKFLIQDINEEYELAVSKLTEDTPNTEKSTWTKQEQEAKAYIIDNTISTPFIDALVSSRRCDKEILIQKIIAKSELYTTALATLTGIRQKKLDELGL